MCAKHWQVYKDQDRRFGWKGKTVGRWKVYEYFDPEMYGRFEAFG
jgi:hypothetical protein